MCVKNLVRKEKPQVTGRILSPGEMNEIIFKSINGKGLITLNRPKVLNALNVLMTSKLYSKLLEWETEKTCVIIKGAGEKCFCAGGDIREIAQSRRDPVELLRRSYIMNNLIKGYKIPYIALINGIVMGGGVGVSAHGRYRIVTERTLFAMPEAAIGLFPDVGTTYILSRLSGKLGRFLGLTGHRLKGVDVLKAGIATHYCESYKIQELEDVLLNSNNENDIKEALIKYSSIPIVEFSLTPYLEKINKCFAPSTIEGIIEELEKDGTPWAKDIVGMLSKMSPVSLKIALRAINSAESLELEECLKMEYRLATKCLQSTNFYEGVRAVLIDKDKKPAWNPNTLSGASDEMVNYYFIKLPECDELDFKMYIRNKM